jgi:hypothetical protein
MESFVRLFVASLGEDHDFYLNLKLCTSTIHRTMGEIMFVIYQLFVSLLQLNLLIAGMIFLASQTNFSTSHDSYLRTYIQN